MLFVKMGDVGFVWDLYVIWIMVVFEFKVNCLVEYGMGNMDGEGLIFFMVKYVIEVMINNFVLWVVKLFFKFVVNEFVV